jgi:outer membrane protein assembly factor BamB
MNHRLILALLLCLSVDGVTGLNVQDASPAHPHHEAGTNDPADNQGKGVQWNSEPSSADDSRGQGWGNKNPQPAHFKQHWNQFRGPNGVGRIEGFQPPRQVLPAAAAWSASLPPGNSSPVLWEDRLFVTGVEGNRLVTLALDASSGVILWKQQAPEVPLERLHKANSAASSTPCVDDAAVYVYFGSYGLLCYDHDGHLRWSKPIPPPQSMYGVATSPILNETQLILVLDDDADLPDSRLSRSKMIALDKATGAVLWEAARPYQRGAWSTPVIWNHGRGTDLVVLGNGRVYGYDPASGSERWFVSGFAREPIALPVVGGGKLFVSVSMQGGRGDSQLDPEPFWRAMLQFDRDADGRVARTEITEPFTLPFRPELPVEHSGFGLPLPSDPVSRKQRQLDLFDWLDKDKDGFLTRDEFIADMTVGRGEPNLAAIQPGGSGDVTETHVSWNLRRGIPEIPSPIFHEGRLYLIRDGGILTCVRADNGEVVYRERMGAAGQYMASPVIAQNHLYLVSARGAVTVVKCGDDFQVASQTDLGAPVAATPAMDRNSLYIRTDGALLAFR